MVLQLNEQFVSLLSEELVPRWEGRAKPHVYGVAAIEGGPIVVGTSGNGGGLYALDEQRGALLAETRLPGGAWDPVSVDGTRFIASTFGEGLAVADGRTGAVETIRVKGASGIAGTRDGRVLLLCSEAHAGLQIVDVRP